MAKQLITVPTEVKDIASAIASGQMKNAKMEWRDDGSVLFTADSPDGTSRITLEKNAFAGIEESSKIDISKPRSKEERLERVQKLHARGKTQQEIAHYTMTCQKTVSNDIKELKSEGVIE